MLPPIIRYPFALCQTPAPNLRLCGRAVSGALRLAGFPPAAAGSAAGTGDSPAAYHQLNRRPVTKTVTGMAML